MNGSSGLPRGDARPRFPQGPHVVGLFLFESVRYDGIFSRFFARLSLIGTPIAVVISAVLVLVV